MDTCCHNQHTAWSWRSLDNRLYCILLLPYFLASKAGGDGQTPLIPHEIVKNWSDPRGSNPLPFGWKPKMQPVTPRSRFQKLVPAEGVEPPCLTAAVSKTAVYAFHHTGMADPAGFEPAIRGSKPRAFGRAKLRVNGTLCPGVERGPGSDIIKGL